MFIGHYALGLASRKIAPLPSLAVLFIAVQLLDLIWPILSILGVETFQIEVGNTQMTPLNFTFYPYSHSLLMAFVWGLLLGGAYFIFSKNRPAALLVSGLVLSHWILDFITHGPDLPLTPFSNYKVGLGLWNYPVIEPILEIGMFIVGTIWYYQAANPKRKIAFWSLITFFLIIHMMNMFGPPPPSIDAVMWSANLMWLFVIWAWWIERK